jgi:hypothetical protein
MNRQTSVQHTSEPNSLSTPLSPMVGACWSIVTVYFYMSWRKVWMNEQSPLGGISLSPAFVIMFVMQHYQLSWEDALHLVQNRRYCISPNGGFLTQIKVSCERIIRQIADTRVTEQEYESIYKANLAVSMFPANHQAAPRRKREDDDDDDDDERYVGTFDGAAITDQLQERTNVHLSTPTHHTILMPWNHDCPHCCLYLALFSCRPHSCF